MAQQVNGSVSKTDNVSLVWSLEPTLGRKRANPARCPILCSDTHATT